MGDKAWVIDLSKHPMNNATKQIYPGVVCWPGSVLALLCAVSKWVNRYEAEMTPCSTRTQHWVRHGDIQGTCTGTIYVWRVHWLISCAWHMLNDAFAYGWTRWICEMLGCEVPTGQTHLGRCLWCLASFSFSCQRARLQNSPHDCGDERWVSLIGHTLKQTIYLPRPTSQHLQGFGFRRKLPQNLEDPRKYSEKFWVDLA